MKINFIASLDCYNHKKWKKFCTKCEYDYEFWVERIHSPTSFVQTYKVIHSGCSGCEYKGRVNKHPEYINCERCNFITPLCVMESNININICKSCDIECFGNIYLDVPIRENDTVKKLGATWDKNYKKWFVQKNHANIDLVLQTFQTWE